MTIVRVQTGGFDQYGDPIDGETRTTIVGAFTAPRTSNDVDDRGRQGVVVGLTLFTPYGTELEAIDKVEVDGVLYSIDGDVGRWLNPLTEWEAGTETALVRAVG